MRPGFRLLLLVGAAASAGGVVFSVTASSVWLGVASLLAAAATGAAGAWGWSQMKLRALTLRADNALGVPASEQGFRRSDAAEEARLAASVTTLAQEAAKLRAVADRDRLHLAAIVDAMTQGMIVVDHENRIELLNDAARRILDLKQGAEGTPLIECIRVPEVFDVLRAPDSSHTEVELRSGGKVVIRGTRRWGDGARILLLEDVTEVRRLETIRRDFVANVSHELRTPVAVIRANAETLAGGALSAPGMAEKLVDGLHRNAERLALMLADLLDLSRLDAGQYRLDPEPVVFVHGVRQALTAVEAGAAERRIDIQVEVDPQLRVLADVRALDQVLVNLVDNAIKYTQPSGHVWITAQPRDAEVRVEVRDDGVGIPAHHRARVFERFYRADPRGSREKGGTGLGLSIVKHLVESMGGAVGVEPNHPQGSVFWFTLPRSQ